MTGDDGWRPWFAWHPVYVDAYTNAEIYRGQMRYRVWLRWVERGHDPRDQSQGGWKYRLPQIGSAK